MGLPKGFAKQVSSTSLPVLAILVCMYVCEALSRYRLLLHTNTCTTAKSVLLLLLQRFSLSVGSTQV